MLCQFSFSLPSLMNNSVIANSFVRFDGRCDNSNDKKRGNSLTKASKCIIIFKLFQPQSHAMGLNRSYVIPMNFLKHRNKQKTKHHFDQISMSSAYFTYLDASSKIDQQNNGFVPFRTMKVMFFVLGPMVYHIKVVVTITIHLIQDCI